MNKLSSKKPLVMFLGILLLVTMACGSSTPEIALPESTTVPDENPTAAPTAVPPTEEASVEPLGSSPDHPVPITEKLVMPEWEIQVLGVLRGDEAIAMLKQVSAFNKAHEDPNMEYVLVNMRVKYLGTEDTAYVYGKMFRGTGSANEIYKSVSFIDVEVPDPELEADLPSGGETEGWVAIEVGKDEAGIMLVFWPYVSYENNTATFSEATPKGFISLEP